MKSFKRFCIAPSVTKFYHFGKNINKLCEFFEGLFVSWPNIEPTLEFLNTIVQIFVAVNGQILNK